MATSMSDAVHLVQSNLALIEAKELGFDLEGASAIGPDARVVGRRLGTSATVLGSFGCAATLRDSNVLGSTADFVVLGR